MKMTKFEMIEKIRNAANFYSAFATSSAIEAVRYPSNSEKMETAQRALLKHEIRSEFAKEIINLINDNWPTDMEAK